MSYDSDSFEFTGRRRNPFEVISLVSSESEEMEQDDEPSAFSRSQTPVRRRRDLSRGRANDDSPRSRDDSPPPRPSRTPVVASSVLRPRATKGSGKRATGPKSSQWMYTLHYPKADDFQRLQALHLLPSTGVTYHVFQCEYTPSDGHPHLQGYICFKSGKQMSTVKALFREEVHLEPTKGTPDEASEYCSRPDKRHPDYRDFIFETGTMPASLAGKGKRSDLNTVKVLLDEGTHPNQVMQLPEHFTASARYWKFFQHYYNAIAPDRTSAPYVFVLYGAPGTGKTMAASRFRDAYYAPTGSSGTQWYDGYDPRKHQSIVFNEFSGNRMALGELLRLMDREPMQVNRKGAYVTFNPKCLVFTSNFEPRTWYGWDDPEKREHLSSPYEALERRLLSIWNYQLIASVPHLRSDAELACAPAAVRAVCFCEKGNPEYHPFVTTGLYKKIGDNVFAIPDIGDELRETLPAEDLDYFV